MKQKLFTLLLAFIAAISFAGAKDIASGTFKNGGTWKISEQGELYIDATTVPDYKTADKAPWHAYATQIKYIRFGVGGNSNATLTIGKNAFAAGTYIFTKVSFDNRTGNVVINENAFKACGKLEDFDFSNVTIIGESAFASCGKLQSNVFAKLQSAGYEAFYGCYQLATQGNIVLTGNVPSSNDALEGFRFLADICTSGVSDGAWYSSPQNGVDTYIDKDGNKYYKRYNIKPKTPFDFVVSADKLNAFVAKFGQHPFSMNNIWLCAGGDGWRLRPDGNMHISLYALGQDYANPSDRPWHAVRTQITEITTENRGFYSVVKFGKNVFHGCTELQFFNMTFENDNSAPHYKTDEVHDYAFYGCSKLTRLGTIIPYCSKIGTHAFENCQHLGDVLLP